MSLLTYDKGMAVLNLIFVQVRKVSSLATKTTWLDLEEDLRVWLKHAFSRKVTSLAGSLTSYRAHLGESIKGKLEPILCTAKTSSKRGHSNFPPPKRL